MDQYQRVNTQKLTTHLFATTNIDSGDYEGYHEQVLVNGTYTRPDFAWNDVAEGEMIHYCFIDPPDKYIKLFNRYDTIHRYRLLLLLKMKCSQTNNFQTL